MPETIERGRPPDETIPPEGAAGEISTPEVGPIADWSALDRLEESEQARHVVDEAVSEEDSRDPVPTAFDRHLASVQDPNVRWELVDARRQKFINETVAPYEAELAFIESTVPRGLGGFFDMFSQWARGFPRRRAYDRTLNEAFKIRDEQLAIFDAKYSYDPVSPAEKAQRMQASEPYKQAAERNKEQIGETILRAPHRALIYGLHYVGNQLAAILEAHDASTEFHGKTPLHDQITKSTKKKQQ